MLLDTCALLWLANGSNQLRPGILAKIEVASQLYISAISAFEIGRKYRQDKLELALEPEPWFDQMIANYDLIVIPLTIPICLAATALPMFHKDPADRFIIATAKLHQWPIVTADPKFKDYGVEIIF